jgi:hypothetical protein
VATSTSTSTTTAVDAVRRAASRGATRRQRIDDDDDDVDARARCHRSATRRRRVDRRTQPRDQSLNRQNAKRLNTLLGRRSATRCASGGGRLCTTVVTRTLLLDAETFRARAARGGARDASLSWSVALDRWSTAFERSVLPATP